jgi:CheY-like chemotaxis protein
MKSNKYNIGLFLLVFSAIFLIIALIAFLVYYSQIQTIQNEKSGEPGVITKLKEIQFLDWKHEWGYDIFFLKNNPEIKYHLEQLPSTPESTYFRENLMKISNSIIGTYDYKSLIFLCKTGKPVFSFPDYTKWDPAYIFHMRFLDSAELTDGIFITNRHFSPDNQKILHLMVPLTKETLCWKKCIGFLLPQTFQVYNNIAEVLLAVKEDDQIVFLNKLQLVVMLFDQEPPWIDALEVLQKIKSHKRYGTMPDFILAISSENIDIKRAYKREANSYIVKPINFEKFIEMAVQIEPYWQVLNEQQKNYI